MGYIHKIHCTLYMHLYNFNDAIRRGLSYLEYKSFCFAMGWTAGWIYLHQDVHIKRRRRGEERFVV